MRMLAYVGALALIGMIVFYAANPMTEAAISAATTPRGTVGLERGDALASGFRRQPARYGRQIIPIRNSPASGGWSQGRPAIRPGRTAADRRDRNLSPRQRGDPRCAARGGTGGPDGPRRDASDPARRVDRDQVRPGDVARPHRRHRHGPPPASASSNRSSRRVCGSRAGIAPATARRSAAPPSPACSTAWCCCRPAMTRRSPRFSPRRNCVAPAAVSTARSRPQRIGFFPDATRTSEERLSLN